MKLLLGRQFLLRNLGALRLEEGGGGGGRGGEGWETLLDVGCAILAVVYLNFRIPVEYETSRKIV